MFHSFLKLFNEHISHENEQLWNYENTYETTAQLNLFTLS